MEENKVIFLRLVREVNKSLRKEWNFKISGVQFVLLRILKEQGALRMSDISEELGVSVSGATNLTNKLVEDGYVKRLNDENDRRVVRLMITDKGVVFFDSMLEQRDAALQPYFGNLTDEELALLMQLSKKMLQK